MKKALAALAAATSLTFGATAVAAGDARAASGTQDLGSVGDAYDHAGASSFSFTGWVRPAKSRSPGARARLISKETSRGGYSMALVAQRAGAQALSFRRRSSAGADAVTATTGLLPGSWHHVAVTYDGRMLTLFVDGRRERSIRSTRRLPDTSAALRLGAAAGRADGSRGRLLDFAAHRRALSEDAVQRLFALRAKLAERVTRPETTPTPAATPSPTATPAPTPVATGRALTRSPNSPVLPDADAAARVRRSPWEPRPLNTVANHRMPTADELSAFRSASRDQTSYASLVTGHFTGTTDELIQWTAHKWGIDEDIVRAQAVWESTWQQPAAGDGGISFGLMQIKSTVWRGTAPLTQLSTAFNVDMHGAILRQCYAGKATWLGNDYRAGDLWGCLGYYYSGVWGDAGGAAYVESVRRHLDERTWEKPGF